MTYPTEQLNRVADSLSLSVLMAVLCLAMAGDMLTTWYGLEHAGLYEANPSARAALEAQGYSMVIVGKTLTALIALCAVSVCARLWPERDSWVVYSPVYAVIALNVAVTAYNGMLILSA